MFLADINSFEYLTPAMKQYVELKKIHENSLLFFRMGDFYELFFDDAIVTSKELNITLTKRGKVQDKDIPMCGIPYHALDNYLPRLIKSGFRIAICEQTQTPEEMKIKGLKGPLKREIVRIITPGTIIEDHLLESKSFNFLACFIIEHFNLYVSWVDISTGVFLSKQIMSSDKKELRYQISNFITKNNFTEILISEDFDKNLIPEHFKSILIDIKNEFFFYETNLKKLLIFYNKDEKFFNKFSSHQIICCGVLLKYLSNSFLNNMPNLKPPVIDSIINYLEIDNVSMKSLEIFEKISGEKKGSLINTIDETLTASGGRLLRQRLGEPLYDKIKINKRLNLIEYFYQNKSQIALLKILLKEVLDIERALTRVSLKNCNPRDILLIADTLIIFEKIRDEIGKEENSQYFNDEIKRIKLKLNFDYNVALEIKNALKTTPYNNLSDRNFIKDGYDEELDMLRLKKDNSSDIILNLQNSYSKKTSINSLKIKFNRVLGYHIDVRVLHINKIKCFDEFIHRQTTAQSSRYTTNELLKIEKDINESNYKTFVRENEILESLKKLILYWAKEIYYISNIISEIDISLMSADQAHLKNYCRPEINLDGNLSIQQGRHPVVEKLNDFTPNNCEVDKKNIWLITGPNMAGKSTFLRQNALLVIMAQTGLYIPAKSAKIGMVDKIFSRVGASDDLSKGQSTFMVEMSETALILERATSNSLIIFDEIGRGTATFDGIAIAWAVLEYLIGNIKSRVLFATHYHELTSLKKKFKSIKNYKMHIKEWDEKIIFLYRVIEGEADKSYGLEVAKLAGFPKNLINRASEILEELEHQNGSKITSLNKNKKNVSKNKNAKIDLIFKNIKLDQIRPIEALNLLYKIKNLIDEK